MKKKNENNYLKLLKSFILNKFFLIFLSVFIIDRLTKLFSLRNCPCVLGSFLNIVNVANRGIAFGIFKTGQYSNLIFVFVTVAALVFLCYMFFSLRVHAQRTGLVLMAAGAVGNLVDRFVYGAVVDILDFHISLWRFPVFNIADASITIGAAIIVISLFLERRTTDKKIVSSGEKKSKPKKRPSATKRSLSQKQVNKTSSKRLKTKGKAKKTGGPAKKAKK
ncbi:MAG: signal peptidase II [Nanoarchaeota archaeon]